MNTIQATGSRKTAVASVRIVAGKGNIHINNKLLENYFPSNTHIKAVKKPLEIIEKLDSYDIRVRVKGGGTTGQAEATQHGIARALCKLNKEYRPAIKKQKLLTRDPRMVERKKYGQPKARKKFTWVKR